MITLILSRPSITNAPYDTHSQQPLTTQIIVMTYHPQLPRGQVTATSSSQQTLPLFIYYMCGITQQQRDTKSLNNNIIDHSHFNKPKPSTPSLYQHRRQNLDWQSYASKIHDLIYVIYRTRGLGPLAHSSHTKSICTQVHQHTKPFTNTSTQKLINNMTITCCHIRLENGLNNDYPQQTFDFHRQLTTIDQQAHNYSLNIHQWPLNNKPQTPKLNINNANKQIGGGIESNADKTMDEVLTVPSKDSITMDDDKWQTHPHNIYIQSNTLLSHLHPDVAWIPPTIIPFQFQQHPLTNTIQPHELEHLRSVCNFDPSTQVIRCTKDHRLLLSTQHFQNLITHNQPTPYSTLIMYTKLLSDHYQIPYLNTDFLLRIKQNGWEDASRYFSNHSRHNRRRTLTRPNIHGEPTIMLPTFFNDSHWLALVRREINDSVLFIYADDMNNSNTEQEIKNLITTQTNSDFCPPNAKWISCKNTYYLPHSNECGPRTLLALHILATDPDPNENILIHLMHPNLAQIARTWIAISLLTGTVHDKNLLAHHNQRIPLLSFQHTATSEPKDLIQWSPGTENSTNFHSAPLGKTVHTHISRPLTNKHLNTLTKEAQGTPPTRYSHTSLTKITSPTPRLSPDSHLSQTSRSPNDIKPKPSSSKQQTIHKWATNRIAHLTQDDSQYEYPFGHEPTNIDPKTTFRIVMQNPQFSMQLTKDNYEIMQIIQNLTTLQTSAFAIISPNINYCNMSNIIKFTRPFKRTFKQTQPYYHLTIGHPKYAPQNTTKGDMEHFQLPLIKGETEENYP